MAVAPWGPSAKAAPVPSETKLPIAMATAVAAESLRTSLPFQCLDL